VSEDDDMTSHQSRRVRRTVGTGLSLALVAGAGVAATAPLASAIASGRTAVTAPTAVTPQAVTAPVQARVVSTPKAGVAPMALVTSACTGTATISCELFARTGTTQVKVSDTSTPTVTVWKFSDTDTEPGAASSVLVGKVGVPMTITLHNNLPVDTPLGFAVPQLDGVHFTTSIAQGASDTVTFTPDRAGTFTYQAGLGATGSRQVSMGLVGALVVRPNAAQPSAVPGDDADRTKGTAYDALEQGYDDEAVLVYTDVDTRLAANPLGFSMRSWAPQYHLLNGQAYPDTQSVVSDAGRKVMLRVVNGGILEKSPTLLGTRMTVVAKGSRPVPTPMEVSGRLINTGDTFDARVTMPAAADSRYALYDSPGVLHNAGGINPASKNAPMIGGALTFLQAGGVPNVAPAGAKVSLLAVTGAPGVASADGVTARGLDVSAHFSTVGRGDGDIVDAEYYIDTLDPDATGKASPGTGTPITGFGTAGTGVDVTWPFGDAQLTGLSSGLHTLWVRGKDSFGAWGPLASARFLVDNDGPTVTGLTLSDTYVGGPDSADLDLAATIDDRKNGGSTVVDARAWVGTSDDPTAAAEIAPQTVATNGPRTVAAGDGTFALADLQALPEGVHTLHVQGKDVHGHWGAVRNATFTVDKTAPTVTSVKVVPTVTNGLNGSPAKPTTITVTAAITDSGSPITTVEAYVGATPGPKDSPLGVLLSPVGNGTWTGDVPLAWLAGIKADGPVAFSVAATDAAGNRSSTSPAAALLLDRTRPAFVLSAVQGVGFPANRTLTVSATVTDLGSGLAYAEYFIGADPGVGRGIRITPVPVVGQPGRWTVSGAYDLAYANLVDGRIITATLRVRDAALNWSQATRSVDLTDLRLFRNGFQTFEAQPWTAVNGTVQYVTGAAALAGGRSLGTPLTSAGSAAKTIATIPAVGGATMDVLHATFVMAADAGSRTGCPTGTALTCNPEGRTVFAAQSVGGATSIATVEWGRGVANGQTKFRLTVRTGASTTATSGWRTVAAANVYTVLVDWSSGTSRTTTLRVNGTTITVQANTSAYHVGQVRLGLVDPPVGTGVRADIGRLRFDTFVLS
jgi:hypothetical protein